MYSKSEGLIVKAAECRRSIGPRILICWDGLRRFGLGVEQPPKQLMKLAIHDHSLFSWIRFLGWISICQLLIDSSLLFVLCGGSLLVGFIIGFLAGCFALMYKILKGSEEDSKAPYFVRNQNKYPNLLPQPGIKIDCVEKSCAISLTRIIGWTPRLLAGMMMAEDEANNRVQSEQIKLYDVRSFDKGPFSTFKYPIETGCDWTGINFGLDGKMMMLTTNGAVIRVIDAYEGKPMFTLAGYQNNKGLPIEASFTPDSQFVVSGSTDGLLHIWRTEDGRSAGVLTGEHQGPVTNVQFNPRMARVVCNATLPPIVANKDIRGEEATLLGGSTEMSNIYLTCVPFLFN